MKSLRTNRRLQLLAAAVVGVSLFPLVPIATSTATAASSDDNWGRSTTVQQVAVRAAEMYIGIKYKWAGASPSQGFDCSGLVMVAWKVAGTSLPHSSRLQYDHTKHIKYGDLEAGDLIFYHSPISHVAMYVGGGKMIEAPHTGANVRIVSIRKSDVGKYGRVDSGSLASQKNVTVPKDPGNSKNCSDFSSRASAQKAFYKYYPFYGDTFVLDANTDTDKIVCEKTKY